MKLFVTTCAAAAALAVAAPAFASSFHTFAQREAPQQWAPTATQAVRGFSDPRIRVQQLPDTVSMHIVVGLGMRDRVGANNILREQHTPGNPLFRRWLSPAEFTAAFNPTYAQAASVAAYLQRQGFVGITIEPNHLIVSAFAPPSRVESAFHTQIRATNFNGQLIYGNVSAPLVPAQLRGLVVAVLGLSNATQMRVHLTHANVEPSAPASRRGFINQASSTPPPCLSTTGGICVGGEYGPPQYQVAYDAASSVCPATCTGYRTSVAVITEGDDTQVLTDLRTAEAYWGLPKVAYSLRPVGIKSSDTSGLDEWDLDTQMSTGMAQTVKHLYVYDTTSLSDSDIALAYSAWVSDRYTQAGNSSFGEPEALAFADGAMLVDDEELNQAAAQGMTMFASTGDNGEGCPVLLATGAPATGLPETCYPASSPYAVAVGGTTLDTNANGNEPGTYYGEHAWVGTGGGYSAFELAPYWQANGICAECTALAKGGVGRGIADIAMCGDNNGCPADVFVDGAQTGIGGTSLSSPLSMGVWARLESHFYNGLGFAAPVYYGVYGYYEPCAMGNTACVPAGEPGDDTSALPPDTTAPIGGFHDVLFGANGLGVPSGPGWDTPTGMGSIDYCIMQQDISNSIFSGH
ncbi:MAG TPA: S53 family peptidase [Candidatus Eremiobacteraceae bacterium]|nr:S53 family peptidase [Candidatus Eremiobacteraceae bacterium]